MRGGGMAVLEHSAEARGRLPRRVTFHPSVDELGVVLRTCLDCLPQAPGENDFWEVGIAPPLTTAAAAPLSLRCRRRRGYAQNVSSTVQFGVCCGLGVGWGPSLVPFPP